MSGGRGGNGSRGGICGIGQRSEFAAENSDFLGRVDRDANLPLTNRDDRDLDPAVNHQGFTEFASQNEHGTILCV